MSLQTVKEGNLYKRGKINTEWKQRLFVLNGKQLSYFKGGRHTPAGFIELKHIRDITFATEDNVFQIKTPDRTYEIRADTRPAAQEWVDAIRQAKDNS